MKGPARLTLQRADVLEAMQDWVNKQWKESDPPVVKELSSAMGTFTGSTELILHLEGNKLFVTGTA